MAERRADRAASGAPGRVRIIGGSLRGSGLQVGQAPGLRPTADRVRETLFNWLQPVIGGARCLDAFAGSGALGFEACSRGAASVLMLERDPLLAAALAADATRLRAATVQVATADAIAWLGREPDRSFDLVFLDPPFAAGLLQPAIAAVQPWLAAAARVYVEAPVDIEVAAPGWELLREGRTREVRYALYRAGVAVARPGTPAP